MTLNSVLVLYYPICELERRYVFGTGGSLLYGWATAIDETAFDLVCGYCGDDLSVSLLMFRRGFLLSFCGDFYLTVI